MTRIYEDMTEVVGQNEFDYKFNLKNMSKLKLAWKSRTFWSVVVLFVVNGTPAIYAFIPDWLRPLVDAVLGVLIIYFHLNPSQRYDK